MAYQKASYQGNPDDKDQLINWLHGELDEIGRGFFNLDLIRLITQYTAPDKPREGDTRLADGTHWDPGAGQGVYTYYGAAWHKLG